MSGQILGNKSLAKFDVLVIGSGAGGGPVAFLCATKGLKVLVLEAGPSYFVGLDDPNAQPTTLFSNDELEQDERLFMLTDANVEPRTWRNSESDGKRTIVGDVQSLPKHVGGGAVHADLKMPRFIPSDFQLGTRLKNVAGLDGTSFADWPVDYTMLEPFYTYAEVALGVQGLAGAYPNEGPRSKNFPMPPGNPMYVANLVSAGAKKLGLHPFPYPTAVNSRPYDGRPPCVDCGFCSGYGCPSNAKGSPAVTMLRKALLSGNCQLLTETRAVRLFTNSTGTAVTGVAAIDPDGNVQTYAADRYVLAASPIEDARLLFLSDPQGVGNSSGMVGRNLTFHFQTNALGVFDERVHGHRGRTVSHGFADFRGVPGDPTKPMGGIVEISGSEFPIGEGNYYYEIMKLLGGFKPALYKKLLRQSPARDRVVALPMQAEDAPQPTNRVDLDPDVKDLDGLPVARITYQNHAFELSARDFYAPKMLDLLGASGAKYAIIAPIDTIPGSAHIMGTLRMGNDAKTSVCDSTGKLHDIGNLYAADGALFPTSSGFNPTMTIVALSLWVAANIVSPGSPNSAIA